MNKIDIPHVLTSLSIKNFALIDELQVNFSNGLSIITGETGAGKSILLGGLTLVLGKRADLSQIKDSTKKCIVEAVFDIANYDLKTVFDINNLDYDPQTIIRREILPSGKSRAFVNDTPVNLDNLSVLGGHLLDIHSQHQTLKVVDDNFQFKVIDALAGNHESISHYKDILKIYNSKKVELQNLQATSIEAKKEYDYNLFLLNELNDANLTDVDIEDLESSYKQLSNVEQIAEALSICKSQLQSEDIGILEQLNTLKRQISGISSFNKAYQSLEERITSVSIELDDIAQEVEQQEEELILNPLELEKVSSKLQILNNLLHKHAVQTIGELVGIQQELSDKVNKTQYLDDDIRAIISDCEDLEKELKIIAKDIHKSREEIAPLFIKKLETILKDLGMPNARFKIDFKLLDSFTANGMDELAFLFTANKGMPFSMLKKAASGGELSRIMLAIKSILASYVNLPTIMFDEIDTGVSGEISNKMADIMTSMSKHMQVFSITHLPQIAAKGDRHYKVFKTDDAEVTETQIKELQTDERIVEIAQMLGGINITESAMAHAKQLLN